MSKIHKHIIHCLVCFMFIINVFAKEYCVQKYWVFFNDKEGVVFNPYTYFDKKAIERKIQYGIPINDQTDWPVNNIYIDEVKSLVDSVTKASRWFNAVAIFANADQIKLVSNLQCVKGVEEMQSRSVLSSSKKRSEDFDLNLTETEKDLLKKQTERMGAGEFAKNSIDGKGIRIAIFDAGFPTVDVNPAFKHIRKDNRILKTFDFIRNKKNVYGYSSHGTMVFSCIAGKTNGQVIGMATGAEFLLARTESSAFEPFSEEENWLAAVEWADKNGADIINSSLGYTFNRYFVKDMDGKKSLVARAANMAASKGILVINAMGNDATSSWKYIGTPADADSVLAVGGIDPYSDYHISFSSFGPTADKRLKPNVCAYGEVIASGKKTLTTTFGTSFSSPLVAGFAACAWQTKKNLKNMEIFKEIEKSADLYPYFDYAHGYGVPQASYFTEEKQQVKPTFKFQVDEGSLKVIINKDFDDEKIDSIPPDPYSFEFETLLFYHIENNRGYLDKYYVISVQEKEVLKINIDDFTKKETLRIHFSGYTDEYQF